MEEGKRKLNIKKSDKIANRWFRIILITYIVAFAINHLIKLFMVADIYQDYYVSLLPDLLWGPGFGVFLIGLIINELMYFWKCKENKKVVILIVMLCCICSIIYKWMPYSGIYKHCKDLHYVMENTYCEDVQELRNVYINEIKGRWSSKILYIETSDSKFKVLDNIVNESDYDSFKSKYSNVKKVRIKYLPNSNILLSIEPVKD